MDVLYWVEMYLVANLSVTLVGLLSREKEDVKELLPSWLLFGSIYWFIAVIIIVICLLITADWREERRFWWK